MRTISYRGKDKETGKWVYSEGFLKHKDGTIILCTEQRAEDLVTSPIIPETLGQSIGLEDRSGKEIYEGDRVKVGDNLIGVVRYTDGLEMHDHEPYGAMFVIETQHGVIPFDEYGLNHINITGNIHE